MRGLVHHVVAPILTLLLIGGLAADSSLSAAERKSRRLTSAHEIKDDATWSQLSSRPASASAARTEVVKFIVDRDTGRTLWFFDTERYTFHYAFAQERLWTLFRPVPDHATFNRREYHTDARRFEMGSVIHYLDPDLWTMELVSGDTLDGEKILTLYQQVRDALWIGDRLRFRPASALHENAIAGVRDRLPIATSDEIFAGIRYQPLTSGTAFGTLRIVRGPLDPASVRPDQILILETLPEEIPVCAGVISQELQAPLGHIALLCASRNTPNMGLREALSHADIVSNEGKLVALAIEPQEFSLRPASHEEATKAWNRRRPKRPQVPRLQRKETRLVDVDQLRLRDAAFAGAKAAQLGEVGRIRPRITTPGGFIIPMVYYLNHLERCGAGALVRAALADTEVIANAAARTSRLASIRGLIEQTAPDPELIAAVHARIQAIAPDSRWILRSSTNAEDLAGFTGAGLYRSVRWKPQSGPDGLARAIGEVWASVWLQGAFEERAWYRIDHEAVAMAILVQPFVDGASANGVAITANPFAEFRPGVLINAQALGGSVTGAAGEEVPEQHLVYTFNDEFEDELLSRSSRVATEALLLGPAEINSLTEVLLQLHEHFVPRWRGGANAVDVEFLIAGEERRVVILQARPFTVSYLSGQRFDP